MATILICALEQKGHVGPTFRLARTLTARGHEVIYVGRWESRELAAFDPHAEPGIGEFIRARGFRYVPFTELLLQRQSGNRLDKVLDLLTWVASRSHPYQTLRSVLENLHCTQLLRLLVRSEREHHVRMRPRKHTLFRTGGISDDLRDLHPDLCLVDVYAEIDLFFAARRLGVPLLRYSVTLPQGESRDVAPLDTMLPPAAAGGARRAITDAWRHVRRRKLMQPHELMQRIHVIVTALLTGTPLRAFDFSTELSPFFFNAVPVLVFCPQVFELPQQRRPSVIYVEPSIDDESPEQHRSFPVEWLDPSRCLVLCAFGSQWRRYDAARLHEFIRSVIEVARHRPDYQIVISAGGLAATITEPLPSNVLLSEWIPQRELLERATVFISHGGMSSLKESLINGVPLIVIPQDKDQPGNAARVVFHRVGLALTLHDDPTHAEVMRAIDALVDPPAVMRESLRRFQEIYRAAEEAHLAAQAIEDALAGRSGRLFVGDGVKPV